MEVRRVVPALLNPPPFLPPSSPFGAFGVSRGENTGEESAVGRGEWSGADETRRRVTGAEVTSPKQSTGTGTEEALCKKALEK